MDSALANPEKAKLHAQEKMERAQDELHAARRDSRSRKPGTEASGAGGPGPRKTRRRDGTHPADGRSDGDGTTVENGTGPTDSQTPVRPAPAWSTRICCQPLENGVAHTKRFFGLHVTRQPEAKRGCRNDGDRARPVGITIRSGTSERAGLDYEGVPDESPHTRDRRTGSLSSPFPQGTPTPIADRRG